MRSFKLICLLFIAFLICLPSMVKAQTNQGYSGSGSGTESDPYRILEASDLDQMRNFLGKSGVYFKIMDDIDLTDWINDNNPSQGWQPIGVESSKFQGVLDGNGKTISGLMINRSSTNYVGFFGTLSGATVKNLTLKGSTIVGGGNTGALTGYTDGTTITNVKVELTSVTGSSNTGGLVGINSQTSTISSSTVNTIIAGTGTGHGGFIGQNNGTLTISGSKATGNVSGTEKVGGIVGYSTVTLTMSNCTSAGNVTGSSQHVGGLVGYGKTSTLTTCSSEGNVKGTTKVGGMIGEAVTASLTSVTSTGNVTGTSDNVGGGIGYCQKATLKKCSSVGDITGQNYVGGLVGHKVETSTKLVVENSFALGNVNGKINVGGVVGRLERSENDYQTRIKAATTYTTKYSKSSVSVGNTSTYSGYQIIDTKYYSWNNGGSFYSGTYTYKNTLVPTSANVTIKLSDTSYNVDNATAFPGYAIVAKFDYSSDNNGYYYTSTGYNSSKTSSSFKYKYLLISYSAEGLSQVNNSYFNGEITGESEVGGIVGFAQIADITKNYSAAAINGKTNIGGIVGKLDVGLYGVSTNSTLTSNVAINSTVNASTSGAGRIYGAVGSNWTIGTLGSATTNKAMLTTQVSVNGVAKNISDDLQNGNTVGVATLKKKATYQGIGWDMTTNWNLQETESYPYKSWQTAPPIIQNGATSGSTSITGKCVDNGTVYLSIGDKDYVATVSGNSWTATVDALQAGTQIRVYAKSSTKAKSYSATSYVTYPGSGTADDPYQIYSVADLVGINGNSHYLLMNDLDLTSWINANSPTKGWVPIGRNNSVASNFDGGNHTISGLWTNTTEAYTGLFANASSATIQNLVVKVADEKSVKGGTNTAALLGNGTNTKIIKCSIYGNVNGGENSALLVGNLSGGSIESCYVKGSVTASNFAGGLAGNTTGTLTSSTSDANVSGTEYVGGIAGYNTAVISKCVSTGTITATAASAFAGGIVGKAGASVSLCNSAGKVIASNTTTYAGGIAGYTNSGISITNCYSTADVTGTGYVAGVVAYNCGPVNNCYAAGNLTCTGWGAGIVGYNDGSSAYVKNCVALCPKIELTESNGTAKRVIGGYKNGAPDPAKTDNYAMKEMVLSANGSAMTVTDNILNGTAKENSELQTYNFYKNTVAWDITTLSTAKDKIWYIESGSQYPLLFITMTSAPVVVTTQVTSITFDKTQLAMYVGGSATLVATINPEDATVKTLAWASSNESVATVNASGVITAMAPGNATVTATAEDGSEVKATCTISVTANPNNLYAGNVNSKANSTVTIPIYLDNALDMCTAQFDIKLPAGIEMDYTTNRNNKKVYSINLGNERFEGLDHTISVSEQSDGSLRIVINSISNASFWDKNNNGQDIRTSAPLVNMIVRTAENLAEGQYTVNISNVILAHYDEESKTTKNSANTRPSTITIVNACHVTVQSEDVSKGTVLVSGSSYNASTGETNLNSEITITATPKPGYIFLYWLEDKKELSRGTTATITINTNRDITAVFALLGDTYEDDLIDVADVTTEVGYILNNTKLDYREMKIADVYSDNIIDVADVASVVGLILSPTQANTRTKMRMSSSPDAYLSVVDLDQRENKLILGLSLDASAEYMNALQFDVSLPEGISFDPIRPLQLSADLSHALAYKIQEDGSLRVVMYSPSFDNFTTEDGNIISLSLDVDENILMGVYDIEIKNIKGFNINRQAVSMEDVKHQISVGATTSINGLYHDDNSIIYNMSGVRIPSNPFSTNNVPGGVYIINGKKMLKR